MKKILLVIFTVLFVLPAYSQTQDDLLGRLVDGEGVCVILHDEIETDYGNLCPGTKYKLKYVRNELYNYGCNERYGKKYETHDRFSRTDLDDHYLGLWGFLFYYDNHGNIYHKKTKEHIGRIYKCSY